MAEPLLVIGNRTYSSWSLRPWLFMRVLGVPFREKRVALYQSSTAAELRSLSPSGKVPVLHDDGIVVWDSLAICEHVAERLPDGRAWPADPAARAMARSVSAEMHSGFTALRNECPMNCRVRYPGFHIPDPVVPEIARVKEIWQKCRQRHGGAGPWLFGGFSIADAMYAPVVLRFVTYGVTLGEVELAYARTVLRHPATQEWISHAGWEGEALERFERKGLATEPFEAP